MDTPSHFFNDCLDLEDESIAAYHHHSPDHDVVVGGSGVGDSSGGLQAFQPFNGKLDIDDSPAFADTRALAPREVWGDFAEHIGAMVGDHKPLFVDPGLYDEDNDSEEIKGQIQALSDDMSQSSSRRTSSSKSVSQRTTKSASASTDITPPEQDTPPSKKRKTRKTRKESNTAEEEQKRSKFLERNRIAASKCREKKKQYVSDLEETKIGLEMQHAHLQMEYNGLLGEVSGLKHHLMAHAKCNDPNIDRWLDNEARRFVQTSNELFGQAFTPTFGQSGPPSIPTGSPRSRNASIASAYQALQGVQIDGLGSGERQDSIAYSHGTQDFPDSFMTIPELTRSGSSLYTSPTDPGFPPITSPAMKREPGVNYDHMPDAMFSPGQTAGFGGG
ncbi:transcription factor atf21 [Naviculisporaceae sp. PSN 640]